MKNTSKGFSIVELSIVVAIMAILVTILIHSVSRVAPKEDHNVCVVTYKDGSTENLPCLGAYTDEPLIFGSAKNLVVSGIDFHREIPLSGVKTWVLMRNNR